MMGFLKIMVRLNDLESLDTDALEEILVWGDRVILVTEDPEILDSGKTDPAGA